jgi:catechol 2,3-dioxygenase-like lactoylglutathione lyase family enzyme
MEGMTTVGAAGGGLAVEAESGAKILRSIAIVTHAVADLDIAESAWSGVPGYRTVERGRLTTDLCAAWDAPAAVGERYCLMQPASGEAVYLRFVETGERGHGPPATRGWSATELLVTDTDDLARRLEGSAFRRLGGPGNLYARENAPRAMQVIGPSGELVYFTRLLPGGSRYGLKQARTDVDRPFIVTVGGPSGPAMHAFYGGVLGLRIMDRTPFVNSILAYLYGVPADTVFPTAVARIPGRRFLLQLDQCPPVVPPRRRREGHLPPGLAMVSFAVRDLDELARLQPESPAMRAPARVIEGAAYGGRRVAVIEGPVGEWLELIEESPR